MSIDSHSVVACGNCRFEYVTDPIDWAKIQSKSKAKKRRDIPRHQILAKYATTLGAKSIIEVGSGVGELGYLLTKRGFDYLGIEPDERRAAACQEIGLDVRATILEGIPNDRKADLIVIDNVLEHVIDPVGILKESRKHLTPNGTLVVVVPNRNDIRRIVPAWRKKNLWLPKVHINYFTGSSLQRTFALAGFDPSNFPSSTLFGTSSLSRSVALILNSRGMFPFGIYMIGKPAE
jgi:SAM-dependent methyltransferase